MMHGPPLRVVRSVFNMLTFKSDGTSVPPNITLRARNRMTAQVALFHMARIRLGTIDMGKPTCDEFIAALCNDKLNIVGDENVTRFSPWLGKVSVS